MKDGRPRVLGTITPSEGYGRLFVWCRHCKQWWPTEPPANDAELEPLRCCRIDPRNNRPPTEAEIALSGGPGALLLLHTHGEGLALADLKPEAVLSLPCQQHRKLKNTITFYPAGKPLRYHQQYGLTDRNDRHPLFKSAAS